MWQAAVVGGLCTVGFLDSLYFTLVQYRILPPDPRWLPRFCRVEQGRCLSLLQAPEARLLWIPNSVVGLGFYPGVFAAALLGQLGDRRWLGAALVVALGAVLASFYLVWALLRRLRIHCPLCYLAHVVNAALLALLIFAARTGWR
ncbi:MAG: vitamin K epoxide reductase family protein [Armatimonadota bacterium]|nr:vitamin K epoxide reductase family protein [Armatimonadota bacterium]MDR7439132.1 vitamin K epoxide reductase family protein [Armatimonadota bacterium]MDR7562147.1 vitamin K epoxide reductase family protein [Armatimonadota bacterium]MDR7567621.1 vitamin K epoxide reductase family protein [Armatimonadota bacterium]MDR7602341.1 vitamin K epoxide reductase family protein [Armatimonadota bacterium]